MDKTNLDVHIEKKARIDIPQNYRVVSFKDFKPSTKGWTPIDAITKDCKTDEEKIKALKNFNIELSRILKE